MKYPAEFPIHLKPTVDEIILEASRDFPRENQAKARIKQEFFALCNLTCQAAESGEWRIDLANEGIREFLDLLCEDDIGGFWFTDNVMAFNRWSLPIIQEILDSDEWLDCVKRLAAIGRSMAGSTKINPHGISMISKDTILKILKEKGLTRSKWASLAGVDPSVVYDYLDGKSKPRAESRKALAEAIGLKVHELP